MPFSKDLHLKDINPEWSEKRSGYRKLDEVPIRFVPVVSSYDAEPDNSNSFSLSLNPSSTPEVKIKQEWRSGDREGVQEGWSGAAGHQEALLWERRSIPQVEDPTGSRHQESSLRVFQSKTGYGRSHALWRPFEVMEIVAQE